ncbi:hypothetical protein DFJ73DRAFT_847319 [Zopfochytrium polystomum]|nr:hypothetical protein DFJ73DRAFT_847319 [Zopfochytrium polystomum]
MTFATSQPIAIPPTNKTANGGAGIGSISAAFAAAAARDKKAAMSTSVASASSDTLVLLEDSLSSSPQSPTSLSSSFTGATLHHLNHYGTSLNSAGHRSTHYPHPPQHALSVDSFGGGPLRAGMSVPVLASSPPSAAAGMADLAGRRRRSMSLHESTIFGSPVQIGASWAPEVRTRDRTLSLVRAVEVFSVLSPVRHILIFIFFRFSTWLTPPKRPSTGKAQQCIPTSPSPSQGRKREDVTITS